MKKKTMMLLSAAVLIAMTGCSQATYPEVTKPEQAQPVVSDANDIVKTSEMDRAPLILGDSQSLEAMSVGNSADVMKIFGGAQTVVPVKLWEPRKQGVGAQSLPQQNGYTLTFYDFNGVSFAYVNQVAKDRPNMTPVEMASIYKDTTSYSSDFTQWTEATYVTGANTRRTTISDVLPSFPILKGIYGTESTSKGFNVSQVSHYVMPREGQYWALMNDGRYFDLLARNWVSADMVAQAQNDYQQIISQAAASSDFNSYSTSMWQGMNNDFMVNPSPCRRGQSCIDDPIYIMSLENQTVEEKLNTRTQRFLWWSWTTTRTGYTGTFPQSQLPILDGI